MTVYGKIIYVFHMPQDYNEMKRFEAENDLSIYRKTEDTIAVRYKYNVNATYPYKSKVSRKTEPQKDCFLCKWLGDVDVCGRCRNRNLFCEAESQTVIHCKDEIWTEAKEMLKKWAEKDELQTKHPCDTCANKGDHDGECRDCICDSRTIRWEMPSHYKPKDEPQERSE